MLQKMIDEIKIYSNVIKTKNLLTIMNEIEIDTIVKQRKQLTQKELYIWTYIKMKIKEYDKKLIGCNQLKHQLEKWKEESMNNGFRKDN